MVAGCCSGSHSLPLHPIFRNIGPLLVAHDHASSSHGGSSSCKLSAISPPSENEWLPACQAHGADRVPPTSGGEDLLTSGMGRMVHRANMADAAAGVSESQAKPILLATIVPIFPEEPTFTVEVPDGIACSAFMSGTGGRSVSPGGSGRIAPGGSASLTSHVLSILGCSESSALFSARSKGGGIAFWVFNPMAQVNERAARETGVWDIRGDAVLVAPARWQALEPAMPRRQVSGGQSPESLSATAATAARSCKHQHHSEAAPGVISLAHAKRMKRDLLELRAFTRKASRILPGVAAPAAAPAAAAAAAAAAATAVAAGATNNSSTGGSLGLHSEKNAASKALPPPPSLSPSAKTSPPVSPGKAAARGMPGGKGDQGKDLTEAPMEVDADEATLTPPLIAADASASAGAGAGGDLGGFVGAGGGAGPGPGGGGTGGGGTGGGGGGGGGGVNGGGGRDGRQGEEEKGSRAGSSSGDKCLDGGSRSGKNEGASNSCQAAGVECQVASCAGLSARISTLEGNTDTSWMAVLNEQPGVSLSRPPHGMPAGSTQGAQDECNALDSSSDEMKCSPVDGLPSGILQEILGRLGFTELSACAAVSHTWRALIGDDKLLLSTLPIRRRPLSLPLPLQGVSTSRPPHLKTGAGQGQSWNSASVAVGRSSRTASANHRLPLVLLRAAEAGSVDAMVLVAEECAARKHAARALDWYRKAARKGHQGSQFKIGEAYYKGNGDSWPRDEEEALAWLLRAVKNPAGDQSVCASSALLLGYMYLDGEGTHRADNTEAVKWFKLAADLGSKEAQKTVGWLWNTGQF